MRSTGHANGTLFVELCARSRLESLANCFAGGWSAAIVQRRGLLTDAQECDETHNADKPRHCMNKKIYRENDVGGPRFWRERFKEIRSFDSVCAAVAGWATTAAKIA